MKDDDLAFVLFSQGLVDDHAAAAIEAIEAEAKDEDVRLLADALRRHLKAFLRAARLPDSPGDMLHLAAVRILRDRRHALSEAERHHLTDEVLADYTHRRRADAHPWTALLVAAGLGGEYRPVMLPTRDGMLSWEAGAAAYIAGRGPEGKRVAGAMRDAGMASWAAYTRPAQRELDLGAAPETLALSAARRVAVGFLLDDAHQLPVLRLLARVLWIDGVRRRAHQAPSLAMERHREVSRDYLSRSAAASAMRALDMQASVVQAITGAVGHKLVRYVVREMSDQLLRDETTVVSDGALVLPDRPPEAARIVVDGGVEGLAAVLRCKPADLTAALDAGASWKPASTKGQGAWWWIVEGAGPGSRARLIIGPNDYLLPVRSGEAGKALKPVPMIGMPRGVPPRQLAAACEMQLEVTRRMVASSRAMSREGGLRLDEQARVDLALDCGARNRRSAAQLWAAALHPGHGWLVEVGDDLFVLAEHDAEGRNARRFIAEGGRASEAAAARGAEGGRPTTKRRRRRPNIRP